MESVKEVQHEQREKEIKRGLLSLRKLVISYLLSLLSLKVTNITPLT